MLQRPRWVTTTSYTIRGNPPFPRHPRCFSRPAAFTRRRRQRNGERLEFTPRGSATRSRRCRMNLFFSDRRTSVSCCQQIRWVPWDARVSAGCGAVGVPCRAKNGGFRCDGGRSHGSYRPGSLAPIPCRAGGQIPPARRRVGPTIWGPESDHSWGGRESRNALTTDDFSYIITPRRANGPPRATLTH